MSMQSAYAQLIEKLDGFIRKYYTDQLIRGGLYSAALLVVLFLFVSLSEYFGQFGTTARTLLFWSLIAATLVVLVRWVALPMVKLLRLGRTLDHDSAARLVGAHFGEVRDKLLNTLQLRALAEQSPEGQALINASIAQRSAELAPVPFAAAIDLRRNYHYLRYALPPLLVLLLLLVVAPSMITGPTKRLLAHGTEFIPQAPFDFVVEQDLSVPEGQDLPLHVTLAGRVLPQQVDLVMGDKRIPMVRQADGSFLHLFRNVLEPTPFHFSADGYRSAAYTLTPVPDPALLDLVLTVTPPAYLGLEAPPASRTGDVLVPAGSRITWSIRTRSTDSLAFSFGDSTLVLGQQAKDRFALARTVMATQEYAIGTRPAPHSGEQAGPYRIDVMPDLHPTIRVATEADSNSSRQLYFQGEVGDDHGFSRLVFQYRFAQGGDSLPSELRQRSESLRIEPGSTRQRFFHAWDASRIPLQPGDKLEYWFEVWDNDGVQGPKSARSTVQTFQAPTLEDLMHKQDLDSEAIRSQLQKSSQEARELQQEMDKLRRDLLDKKELEWQDRQRLEEMLQRQQNLQKQVERSSEMLQRSLREQRENRDVNERILEKQQQVEELFRNVLNEEMKELYRQVQELMEKLDKDKIQQSMESMKLDQEDLEKELDRALEQFKRLEVEQKAEDIAEQLEKLAEEQQKLAEETKESKGDDPGKKAEQEELNKRFEALQEQMKDLDQKNQDLERPMDIPDLSEDGKQVEKDQQQSKEQLEKQQNKKASESQKKAGDRMEQMAERMRSGMQGGQQQQQEEDMAALRQLLENLVHLSFDQEANMSELQRTPPRAPRLLDIGRQQQKLRADAKVVEDSLFALSKRVPTIQATVNREMNAVNENMDKAREHLAESRANDRHRPMAADRQQRAMTGLNNLALLLDEVLQQMQQQAASMMPGAGDCNKPGGKNPKPGNGKQLQQMRAQQQAMQKQLEEMRKGMEKGGKKPGGSEDGTPGPGGDGMSKQLAQLAAQQAAIRKEMQRLAQELNKDGSGAGNDLQKIAEQMEKNEKDIVNKNITPETLKRQQDITTRLLEAENAQREQEEDEKRRSQEGRDHDHPDPARYFEYLRTKQREAELLRTVPPGLKPYYKTRVDRYFNTFGRP